MMRTDKYFAFFCILCLFCQPVLARCKGRLADLHPFERAVLVVKFFEGIHGKGCYPYVGYGHRILKNEKYTAEMTERQADTLLRADLMKRFEYFKRYGRKDAWLLTLLSYNVGVGRIIGNEKHHKSRLLQKIEAGDRNFYNEYISFCRYKGKILPGLLKRRKVEFELFFVP